jgi:hypothetical protein
MEFKNINWVAGIILRMPTDGTCAIFCKTKYKCIQTTTTLEERAKIGTKTEKSKAKNTSTHKLQPHHE